MEIAINICYVISMYSALCILLSTTIYISISYIPTHAKYFSQQIGSIKEKLEQCCIRSFERGVLLRDQLERYMTDFTNKDEKTRKEEYLSVQPTRTCKNPQSNFL